VQENGEVIGKKQLKFEVLQHLGWRVIFFNIGHPQILNLLSSPSDPADRAINEVIFAEIERVLGRRLHSRRDRDKLIICSE